MNTRLRLMMAGVLTLVVGVGCEGKGEAGTTPAETDTETGIPPVGTQGDTAMTATAGDTVDPSAGTADGDTSATATATGADADSGTDTATATATATGGGGTPVDCDGTTYQCGDGKDNDGDGFIDLFDPECTGPCDDDEGSFQTGIPGDNMDCRQDCFFDGNSGQGDDGCLWDLRCDPANPGEHIGCEYTGGNNCNNQPPNQDPDCIEFCAPFVPPGCDCFGCCEVQTPEGPVWIFLNSSPECALDNLEACTECTPQIEDCGNPCNPEECEVCFGETEPPEGCEEAGCQFGEACMDNADCPDGHYCLMNCCYPPPPG